jgi:hypothetical protein
VPQVLRRAERQRMVEDEAERPRVRAGRVGEDGDPVALCDAEASCPCLDTMRIVYTERDDLVDPRLPKDLLCLQVCGDLLCRSAGSERAREAEEDDSLACHSLGDVHGCGRLARAGEEPRCCRKLIPCGQCPRGPRERRAEHPPPGSETREGCRYRPHAQLEN